MSKQMIEPKDKQDRFYYDADDDVEILLTEEEAKASRDRAASIDDDEDY